MNLIEMEGFLRGKCVPGDMLVNETNAQYLVRKFSELEEILASVAAENAGLKSAVIERNNLSEEIRRAGRPPHTDFWHQSIFMADKKVDDALSSTPATDRFLAEVKAQIMERFAKEQADKARKYREISPGCNGEEECFYAAGQANKFAQQLREAK